MTDRNFSFFFNDTATPEIYNLSLHDALPIALVAAAVGLGRVMPALAAERPPPPRDVMVDDGGTCYSAEDRKSTRLNSSHTVISYAVFCLKKKNIISALCTLF